MSFYLKYYFKAKTKYQVHSPFVFDFIENILEDERDYYFFNTIENYRKNLLSSSTKLKGTGSKAIFIKKRVVRTAVSKRVGQLLFKIANHYKPKRIVELGTSLGISTLYLATPNSKSTTITIEKHPQIGALTQKFFTNLGVKNIEILTGVYEINYQKTLEQVGQPNLVYFNASLSAIELITCFEKGVGDIKPDSIFIISKPYFTKERAANWEKIKTYPVVKLTIDLYQLGIIFFRAEQKEVEHFSLISAWKKPWAILF